MFTISFKSITIACMVTLAMVVGAYQIYDVFFNFETQWYWYFLALFYSVVINEYFGHLCCGHTLFNIDTRRIGYKILVFFNCVDHAWGPPTSFALSHANHHMYADQGYRDSANPRIHRWSWFLNPAHYLYTVLIDWPDKKNYFETQEKKFNHILNDPWTNFCERNSHWLTLIYWSILYMLFPIILFKIVFLGRILVGIYTLFAGIVGHTKHPTAYRNFDTPDQSYNNIILHYLSLCIIPTVLQNNHHGSAYNFTTGHRVRFFELDLSVYPMRLIKYLLEEK